MTTFKWELGDGEMLDMGYSEFVCRPSLAEELLDGGMTHVNGKPGFLTVVYRWENAVQLRWTPKVRRLMPNYQTEPMLETMA